MVVLSKVFPNTYRDSLLLMKMASIVRNMDGVDNAEMLMATGPNKDVLSKTQLFTEDAKNAGNNDLIICVMAENAEKAEKAIYEAEEMVLRGTFDQEIAQIARSMNSAMAMLPEANLTLLSIPGPYVKKEALKALEKGLNVMIFSDNVPLEDEVEIKTLAGNKGLLVMGPDCGTAIINGTALGFANKVRRGSIGLIGASGTGLQEVSVLLHDLGMGISHSIGTGSNDVSDQIGGVTLIQGIKLLEADSTTEVIAVVSKPPGSRTRERALNQLKHCTKSVVVNFLGEYEKSFLKDNILFTVTLEETAVRIVEEMRQSSQSKAFSRNSVRAVLGRAKQESKNLADTQKYIRGLFSGGSLAMEACITLRDRTTSLFGNISLSGVTKLVDSKISQGHSIIDLGADEFTVGKPHPMLEPEMRKERLLAEAKNPEVAVMLMDFVLGYGVHPDPVGATLPLIERAKEIAQGEGRHLIFVGSVCGTDEDPQNKSIQVRMLEEQGVIVLPSNAQAARVAASIVLPS